MEPVVVQVEEVIKLPRPTYDEPIRLDIGGMEVLIYWVSEAVLRIASSEPILKVEVDGQVYPFDTFGNWSTTTLSSSVVEGARRLTVELVD